ncbi:hypothetical protein KQX54_017002 [Cotesia glomerata]|uniref:Uncharacterized protein n=1 Tax=Cotesia glomerata TaxID=32391 RepID=A0AAV7ICN9_COTGL|nr:hypothetical protein KQX54_017002 [Cotesia glomerata]
MQPSFVTEHQKPCKPCPVSRQGCQPDQSVLSFNGYEAFRDLSSTFPWDSTPSTSGNFGKVRNSFANPPDKGQEAEPVYCYGSCRHIFYEKALARLSRSVCVLNNHIMLMSLNRDFIEKLCCGFNIRPKNYSTRHLPS